MDQFCAGAESRKENRQSLESGRQVSFSPVIAVVDDDPSFLRSLGRLLRSAGYGVGLFSSAASFLASLAASIPACVVLDVHMPDMGGFEVQDRLANLQLCIPVILITALDTPQFRERASHAGTVGLLTKPFDGEELIGTIRRTLKE